MRHAKTPASDGETKQGFWPRSSVITAHSYLCWTPDAPDRPGLLLPMSRPAPAPMTWPSFDSLPLAYSYWWLA
jgi:hypothetical protein